MLRPPPTAVCRPVYLDRPQTQTYHQHGTRGGASPTNVGQLTTAPSRFLMPAPFTGPVSEYGVVNGPLRAVFNALPAADAGICGAFCMHRAALCANTTAGAFAAVYSHAYQCGFVKQPINRAQWANAAKRAAYNSAKGYHTYQYKDFPVKQCPNSTPKLFV